MRSVVIMRVRHLTRFALVAPADTQPPDPPSKIKVASLPKGFRVSWNNPSYDFHHTIVYRSTARWKVGNIVFDNLTDTAKDDLFTKKRGVTYYYTVHTIDIAGNESLNLTQFTAAGAVAPQKFSFRRTPDMPSFQRFPNNTLLQAKNDERIWLIQNGFRRVIDRKILASYASLKRAAINEILPSELRQYQQSFLVRYEKSPRIYEVTGGYRQWMNLTAQEFLKSGRRWQGVFIINKKEFDAYKPGADITK